MSGYISKLIEDAWRGFQEAENKILDYLLFKGAYIQPLRLALDISRKNGDAALYNTLSPFLLDSHYLFDIDPTIPTVNESKSIPLSTGRISSDAAILPLEEQVGPKSEDLKLGMLEHKHADMVDTTQPPSVVVESVISEEKEHFEPSETTINPDKPVKKKKKKKKKDWIKIVESSPYIIWLQERKGLESFQAKSKIAKVDKYKKIQESAQKSVKPSSEIISEPLAKLLVSQGHLLEAKKMYKSLMIKFPDLSETYQREIKEINRLIDPGKN